MPEEPDPTLEGWIAGKYIEPDPRDHPHLFHARQRSEINSHDPWFRAPSDWTDADELVEHLGARHRLTHGGGPKNLDEGLGTRLRELRSHEAQHEREVAAMRQNNAQLEQKVAALESKLATTTERRDPEALARTLRFGEDADGLLLEKKPFMMKDKGQSRRVTGRRGWASALKNLVRGEGSASVTESGARDASAALGPFGVKASRSSKGLLVLSPVNGGSLKLEWCEGR